MSAVLTMAKKSEKPPGGGETKRLQTTIRIYVETAQKVNELSTMLKLPIADTLEKLFENRLDNELVEAIEVRAKQLKKKP